MTDIFTTIAERERATCRAIVDRAHLTLGELLHAAETLDKITGINLDDLICAPAFDSLGNGNTQTPEWRQWAAIDDIKQQACRVSNALRRAYEAEL